MRRLRSTEGPRGAGAPLRWFWEGLSMDRSRARTPAERLALVLVLVLAIWALVDVVHGWTEDGATGALRALVSSAGLWLASCLAASLIVPRVSRGMRRRTSDDSSARRQDSPALMGRPECDQGRLVVAPEGVVDGV